MLLSACQTDPIPNARFYSEIPFIDCPEGVWVETVSHKTGFVKCEDWKKIRPFMIMMDPDTKQKVFLKWEEACRFSSDNNGCNVQLDSVKKAAMLLDDLAKATMGGIK